MVRSSGCTKLDWRQVCHGFRQLVGLKPSSDSPAESVHIQFGLWEAAVLRLRHANLTIKAVDWGPGIPYRQHATGLHQAWCRFSQRHEGQGILSCAFETWEGF